MNWKVKQLKISRLTEREKRRKKKTLEMYGAWSNKHVIGIPKGERERENKEETTVKETVMKNFLKLMEDQDSLTIKAG